MICIFNNPTDVQGVVSPQDLDIMLIIERSDIFRDFRDGLRDLRDGFPDFRDGART